METVLVVADRARCDEIKKLFCHGGYAFIRVESEKDARMRILDLQLSLAVVDARLASASPKDISVFASSQEIETVLLVPEDPAGHIAAMMRKYGVYVAVESRDSFLAVMNAIGVARERIRKAEERNRRLLERLRNEKQLTEAKCLLAGRRGMSEKEAHSYIEQRAMDCRISLSDAALGVIRELS